VRIRPHPGPSIPTPPQIIDAAADAAFVRPGDEVGVVVDVDWDAQILAGFGGQRGSVEQGQVGAREHRARIAVDDAGDAHADPDDVTRGDVAFAQEAVDCICEGHTRGAAAGKENVGGRPIIVHDAGIGP
jgi:hypothetical protein